MKRKPKKQAAKNGISQASPTPEGSQSLQGISKSGQAASAPSGSPEPLEPWRERHLLYLEDARQRIGHTRNVLLVWVAALLTILLGSIEKAVIDVDDLHVAVQKKVEAAERAADSKRMVDILYSPTNLPQHDNGPSGKALSAPAAHPSGSGAESVDKSAIEAQPKPAPEGARANEDKIAVELRKEKKGQ